MNLPFSAPSLSIFIAAFLVCPFANSGEPIQLASPSGQSIKAELISISNTDESVTYRRLTDGKVFTSKLGIFDSATQETLKQRGDGDGKNSSQLPLRITVKADHQQVYDQKNNVWKESVVRNFETGANDLMRSEFTLKNRASQDAENLKIDIIVVIGPEKGEGPVREERQTFSILRLKGAGEILVQTKFYPILAIAEEGRNAESIQGTALRLRDAETGEAVFSWKSDKLDNYTVRWDLTDEKRLAVNLSQ